MGSELGSKSIHAPTKLELVQGINKDAVTAITCGYECALRLTPCWDDDMYILRNLLSLHSYSTRHEHAPVVVLVMH
jgi:hypothetical protein